MSAIALVTDSTADLPQDEAERWGIEVVPAVLNVDGETVVDGRDFSRDEFYRRLPDLATLPTTAAPPPDEFAQVYERLLSRGADAVLSIHLASSLSSLCDMARQAASNFGRRVTVFDSRQTSLALGFQVLVAAEAAASGTDLSELLALAQSARQRTRLAALVDSLKYLRRSGRVGWLQGGVAEVLNLRLVLAVDEGEVRRVDLTRTRTAAEKSLLSLVEGWGRLARVAAMHLADPAGAIGLAAKLAPFCESRPIIAEATTVIGTHVGPGAVGVAALVA
jgi:DegV family protein with EDD domain